MYDINVEYIKKGKRTASVFFIPGIVFFLILGGIFLNNTITLIGLDSKVQSTSVNIINKGDTFSTIYNFEIKGQNYSCASGFSSSFKPNTENKPVYYDSKNPTNCMTEYSKTFNFIIFACLIISIAFIIVGIKYLKKINKRIEKILELNVKGKLIKNLPYRLELAEVPGTSNENIQRLIVDYALPSGSVITLYGDARYDRKYFDSDGMVDLLIDVNNPDNYYIDFEINRLTGNLPEDYYQEKNK